jgi:hypothetical protein
MSGPREIERTAREVYWRFQDGTFYAAPPSNQPPPITGGGYYNLQALKRLKGDL